MLLRCWGLLFQIKCKSDIVNRPADNGNTPLHAAANVGDVKMVGTLLNVEGIHVDAVNPQCEHATPLHLAVMHGKRPSIIRNDTCFVSCALPRFAEKQNVSWLKQQTCHRAMEKRKIFDLKCRWIFMRGSAETPSVKYVAMTFLVYEF